MLKLKLLTTGTLIILGITLGISAMPVNAEPTRGEQHIPRDKGTAGEQQSGSPTEK